MIDYQTTNVNGLLLKNFSLMVEDRLLLDNLSLAVKSGEILTIMGPSGSGKSSLLLYIMGLLSPDFKAIGDIILDGKLLNYIVPESRKIGLLFQEDLLMPHLNVLDNLILGIPPGLTKKQKIAKAVDALNNCQLNGYETRSVNKLSGGQKARVALWRTLLSEPRAILLDEPFSKLDYKLKKVVRDYFKKHIIVKKIPAIIVSHDMDDAELSAGHVIQL